MIFVAAFLDVERLQPRVRAHLCEVVFYVDHRARQRATRLVHQRARVFVQRTRVFVQRTRVAIQRTGRVFFVVVGRRIQSAKNIKQNATISASFRKAVASRRTE